MKSSATRLPLAILLVLAVVGMPATRVLAVEKEIPAALQPWESWATWKDQQRHAPKTYRSASEHISVWPSKLSLVADQQEGSWNISVAVFSETWLTIPGSGDTWPVEVRDGDAVVPVVERNGRPAVQLTFGQHILSGKFRWESMPQRIALPVEVGILSLVVEGQPLAIPRWDADGHVWLKRTRADETEKDHLAAQVYRVIEDGIPTKLETEIELTVSGSSREERLGQVLPDGFKLSTVSSPIPVAIDEQGRMRAQVRAGKWTVAVSAFRSTNVPDFQFPEDSQPIINRELIALRGDPQFRLAEIEGLPTVDVTQTTFPNKWRQLPVYQWDTGTAFQLVEKVRGMGLQHPEGLTIQRRFWLEEEGQSFTYHDQISGTMQQIWRLDVAQGQQLGAVHIDGAGQLITENPLTRSHGVEVRSRNLQLEAIGRVDSTNDLPATGWQADAASLEATLIVPPGWRAFAVFGADRVQGDWLTAWSLLDLFLLLVFSLAAFRMWGFTACVVAFMAFGLAYQEPGAPRLTWLFLLIPLALLKVVPAGIAKRGIQVWKYIAVSLLVLNLIPFLAHQIQTAIYPQLEIPGVNYTTRSLFGALGATYESAARVADLASESRELLSPQAVPAAANDARFEVSNLGFDPQARIQTGPAQPQWSWNIVRCAWDGPVSSDQTFRPILISMPVHRAVTLVRILLLVLLTVMMLGFPSVRLAGSKAVVGALLLLGLSLDPTPTMAAEFPDRQLLEELRERLLEPADVFPRAAEIASVAMTISGNRMRMDAEIHAAADVAVPLPGKLTAWAPVAVAVNGSPAKLVCRKDEYLWVVLSRGVHAVSLETLLPDVAEWECPFELRPRRVTVTAPGWTVAGIGPNGMPDEQLLFSRQRQATTDQAAYDQRNFNAIIAIDRYLEIGLVWQVRTEVSRLSDDNKAVSLSIPLLPGEHVLTSATRVENSVIDVTLGSGQSKLSWNSELPVGSDIQLGTKETDSWIERWHVVASPVWNMTQTGLAPVFETAETNLTPVWHPWPGEQVTLAFHKPQAVVGETVTVQTVEHTITLGRRQRASTLRLDVECSVASDFVLKIAPEAEVSSLVHDGQTIPVRRDGDSLFVPIRPGRQVLEVAWKSDTTISLAADTGAVQLPVSGANVTTLVHVPESRWVLWTSGPLQGPAVRFWAILASAILIALIAGALPNSPLGRAEWVLLAIGLTQVHVAAALIVVVWLFAIAYRGSASGVNMKHWLFNLAQIALVGLTFFALIVFIAIVAAGLLGHPDMFIVGNQSSRTHLNWFQPRIDAALPIASVVSISVWYYRLLMLLWALWLANSLVRWLKFGWTQFSTGGCWKRRAKLVTATPIPSTGEGP